MDFGALHEGWDVEVKKAGGRDGRGAIPSALWETYSAMANSQGGVIILGAEERPDGTFQILGIGDPERVERDLWNCLYDRNKVSVNLLDRERARREAVDGKTLLILKVPRARRSERPVFINNNPLTGTYVRGYDGDRRCAPEEVRRMLADADVDHPRDSRILSRYSLADLDPASLSAYRQLFQSRSPGHPFLREKDQGFLQKLGAWKSDRETGEEGPTLAALLMLGREEAIREELPQFHLDYRELPVEGGGIRWLDRVTLDGTWPGNVFGFYHQVMPKLVAGLKVPFHLEPDLLRRDETHVHEALREALVNSLVHADYATPRGIRVFRKPDGYEFLNPGTLLLPIEQIRSGGTSESRNPTLQHMFRMVGIGEKAGSGFPAILQAWREQHWRAPLLEEDVEQYETRLHLTMASLFPDATIQDLGRRFGDRFRHLEESARLALATAWTEGRVTNSRLKELSNRHSRDLTVLLTDLVEKGFLDPHDERRARWYTVAGERSSVQSAEQSSVQSVVSSVQSPAIEAEGELLAQIAQKRWTRRQDMKNAVLLICRGRFVTAAEMASTLGRSAETLRTHYLGRMVEAGELDLRYPDKASHPNQAYRASVDRP